VRVGAGVTCGAQIDWAEEEHRSAGRRDLLQSVPLFLQGSDQTVDRRELGRTRLSPFCEMPDQLRLAMWSNLAVTREGCEDLVVPQILAPGLEFFWCPAQTLAELGQRLAKRVWIGVGQPRAGERLFEDRPDRRGIRSMGAGQAPRLEQVILVLHDHRCRK
jgi:hypothetical protein